MSCLPTRILDTTDRQDRVELWTCDQHFALICLTALSCLSNLSNRTIGMSVCSLFYPMKNWTQS